MCPSALLDGRTAHVELLLLCRGGLLARPVLLLGVLGLDLRLGGTDLLWHELPVNDALLGGSLLSIP